MLISGMGGWRKAVGISVMKSIEWLKHYKWIIAILTLAWTDDMICLELSWNLKIGDYFNASLCFQWEELFSMLEFRHPSAEGLRLKVST